MTRLLSFAGLLVVSLLGACASAPKSEQLFYPDQVRELELAFAQTMTDRDFKRFGSFIADDAIFLNGDRPLRGKAQVLSHWQQFFDAAEAPFYWRPDLIQVLPTGGLAWSSGPVYTKDGKVFSRFHSVWRQEAPGIWKVVYDQGTEVCNCPSRINIEADKVSLPQMATPVPIAPETPIEVPGVELPTVPGQ